MHTSNSTMGETPALILCGGLGTRMHALFPDRPKALIPVLGRPFIRWQIEWLARHGIRRVLLAAGHRAAQLAEWAASQAAPPEIALVAEPTPRGTGGALKFASVALNHDSAWVLNGDSLLPNLDFATMAADHARAAAPVTMAIAPIVETGRYGTVVCDADGYVTQFMEKAQRRSGLVNAGVYLINAAIWRELPSDRNISLETEVFPDLAAMRRLRAFQAPPPLLDMGTPEGIRAMEYVLNKTMKE